MPSSSSSSTLPSSSPLQFRSVLPHEPPLSWSSSSLVSSSSCEYNGYLHIQGALTPKLVPITDYNNNNNNSETPSKDDDKKVESSVLMTTNNNIDMTTNNNDNNDTSNVVMTSTPEFWIQHRTTFEYLLLLQFRQFHQIHYNSHHSLLPSSVDVVPDHGNTCSINNSINNSNSNSSNNNILEPQSVQLLDTLPPFTKIRVQYSTIPAAQYALQLYRKHQITTRLLLLLLLPSNHRVDDNHHDDTDDNNNDNIYIKAMTLRSQLISSSSASLLSPLKDTKSNHHPTNSIIPDRLLQITEITNRPLLPSFVWNHVLPTTATTNTTTTTASAPMATDTNHDQQMMIDTICWTRSNPPKFRRLLPRPYEDEQYIEQQRQSTRFIVITNLLPPLPVAVANHSTTGRTTITTTTTTTENHSTGPSQPTKHTLQQQQQQQILHNMWEQDPISIAHAIRSVFDKYDTSGYGIEVFVPNQTNKRTRYCHIGMRSSHDAQSVVQALQETMVDWSWIGYDDTVHGMNHTTNDIRTITSGKLFIDYAAITQRSMSSKVDTKTIIALDGPSSLIHGMDPASLLLGHPSRPQCTSTTDDIHIPGLIVLPDYISSAEEDVLMAVLTGPQAPWAPSQKTASYVDGTVRRMVQHYGYVFDYQTANVLRDRTTHNSSNSNSISSPANCPPMPAINLPMTRMSLHHHLP